MSEWGDKKNLRGESTMDDAMNLSKKGKKGLTHCSLARTVT